MRQIKKEDLILYKSILFYAINRGSKIKSFLNSTISIAHYIKAEAPTVCGSPTCNGSKDPFLSYDDSSMDTAARTHYYVFSSSSSITSQHRFGGTKWGHAPADFAASNHLIDYQRPALFYIR